MSNFFSVGLFYLIGIIVTWLMCICLAVLVLFIPQTIIDFMLMGLTKGEEL